ncbi:hypothetical protein AVEN_223511-1 [Araneus ventricosus]|uniref:Uncharacterized protein n=1 Tax=Araneus ventricosus TaxID=182803 RepID=A0A4Y2DIR5_ARAVE|nr:hypothetical protein AVEN_223511-1 [Araneus ventricosus]
MEVDLRPMVRQDSHTPARCQRADSLDYPDRWFQSATSKEVFYLQKNPSWERQSAMPNFHSTVNEWLPSTLKNPSAGAERGDVFQ